ncbi:MAG: valine--tRNA ligase [Candidatus Aenigmarchaeota archaeon]|nr:valine--tRNA ligase [Candidatus Aenigmarchaeota archaeon]
MEFSPKIKIKRWDKKIEEETLKIWEKEWDKLYGFMPSSDKIFVIDTPPPYVGPFWHVGAAISYAMQDIIARIYRMLGFQVLYPIGFDRNGIPVEWYVEKYEKINMWETPREVFVEKCKGILDEYVVTMENIMKKFLISGDYKNKYFTDSEEYRKVTQATFIEAWKRGLIYEDYRPNNFCPRCRTVIADSEVIYKEKEGILYYIKFRIKETGEDLIIATTRPELLGACGVIIFNPKDERYKKLENFHAIVPLYNKEVKILPKEEAKPEFGTGIMMICSFGDLTDVKIFRDLQLKPIRIIGEDGKMKDELYNGLSIKEARKKIIEDLKRRNLIVREERLIHSVPVHDKCKTPIEIILMKEFYLKQMKFLEEIKRLGEEMKWAPEKHKQKLIDWINSVKSDWPISRRRYYATEIPLWYCKKCGYVYLPPPGKYYKPWKEDPPIDKCPECGCTEFIGEERVLDTWVDSSISILFITKYKRDDEFFEKVFKGIKLRPQGYEIIRTWLYYTLLRVFQLTGRRAFDMIFINGMGLDARGRKMSKSEGNIIKPEELLREFGAEPVRFWISMECSIGEDYRISKEKIRGSLKFLTKLMNIARFISQFPLIERIDNIEISDEWIINELNKIKKECIELYKNLDFHSAAQKLYKFIWDIFASHYIELCKKRALMNGFSEEEAKSAWYALHYSLKEILKLLAPILPATTDFIYREIYGKSIHLETFGKVEEISEKMLEIGKKLTEFNSFVWNEKKKRGLSLKDKIEISIPEELKSFEKDLKAMHNIF